MSEYQQRLERLQRYLSNLPPVSDRPPNQVLERDSINETDQSSNDEDLINETDQLLHDGDPIKESDQSHHDGDRVNETDQSHNIRDPIKETDQSLHDGDLINESDQSHHGRDPIKETDQLLHDGDHINKSDQSHHVRDPISETDQSSNDGYPVNQTDSSHLENSEIKADSEPSVSNYCEVSSSQLSGEIEPVGSKRVGSSQPASACSIERPVRERLISVTQITASNPSTSRAEFVATRRSAEMDDHADPSMDDPLGSEDSARRSDAADGVVHQRGASYDPARQADSYRSSCEVSGQITASQDTGISNDSTYQSASSSSQLSDDVTSPITDDVMSPDMDDAASSTCGILAPREQVYRSSAHSEEHGAFLCCWRKPRRRRPTEILQMGGQKTRIAGDLGGSEDGSEDVIPRQYGYGRDQYDAKPQNQATRLFFCVLDGVFG